MIYTEYENFKAEFIDPGKDGVVIIKEFTAAANLSDISAELADPERIAWRDNHSTYVNKRGLKIVQNHDTFALKLSDGDQSMTERMPAVMRNARSIQVFIQRLGIIFPSLDNWEADELSLHRYDAKLGLSRHKDNARFIGVIAISALEGECDLEVSNDAGTTAYPTHPGDLIMLRAPGLIDSDEDLRPEHAVVNVRTPTRTSLMLRANNRPDETIPGFHYENWSPAIPAEITD